MVLTHIYKLYIFISTLYTEFFLKFKSYMKASLATTAGRRTQLLITWRLGAVCGCADGVGHVDSAVAGDAGDKVRPEAARAAGLPLEAVAGGLPVRRGAGGGVEAPDAAAAGRRGGGLPAHGIPDAGGQHAHHLRPHVTALTTGADTRSATRTAATVSCWALVRDMASIQGSASNSLWLMSFECGADTDASEDD
jgi:hypothetical protein